MIITINMVSNKLILKNNLLTTFIKWGRTLSKQVKYNT